MTPWRTHFLIGLALVLFQGYDAEADELIMQNGDRLTGKVVKKEHDTLEFKTSYAGTLKVKWAQVSELHLDTPAKVLLSNEEVISARRVKNTEEITTVEPELGMSPRTLNRSEVAFINPEAWRLGHSARFSGGVNFALKSERGNTDTDEIDLDGQLTWRLRQHRITLTGALENDRNQGKRTTEKWLLLSKYNYFLSKPLYTGGILYLEHDQFADLTLRSGLGPLVGYEFIQSKPMNLTAELGILRVREDFKKEPDNNYWAGSWSIDFDKFLIPDIMQFYHYQTGLWNLEKTNDVVWKTWTGLRFPLVAGFTISTEVDLEYDGGAAMSADELATIYQLKLGYQW